MSGFTDKPQKFHVGLNIAGALRRPDEELDFIIANNGRELSGAEAKHLLFNMRQRNPELVMFTGDGCDNQDSSGTCQGHDSPE